MASTPPTRLLTRTDVAALVDMPAVMAAVESAFLAHARGETQMPVKVYLEFPQVQGDLRAMPASVAGAAGLKWINSHALNPQRHGLPAVRGVLLLSDPETADLLAIMDATLITALRTGACAGIATRVLAREDARSLGLVGCGAQAPHLLAAVRAARPAIDDIRVYDRDAEAARGFAARFGAVAASLETVCASDVLCTATPSRVPYVPAGLVVPGAHVNAMGADAHGKQEFDVAILREARVYVDDLAQASGSGEINVGLAQGELGVRDLAGTLGEVLAGTAPGRRSAEEITLFDSTGLAIQDVAVAALVFERAVAGERGLEVDLFR